MAVCEFCFKKYDETKAMGVCPHCGHVEGEPQSDLRFLPIGTRVGRKYIVGGAIGDGGFGITYRVWDMELHTVMAMKEYYQLGVVNRIPGTTQVFVVAPNRMGEFEYGKNRLLREAQIVSKFQSSAIVRVNDYFEENGTSYMIMEYLECDTLSGYIKRLNRTLEMPEAESITIQICDALSEMHDAGVIHRDIAPDNIFVMRQGNKLKIKIIDFGSARLSQNDTLEKLILVKEGFSPIEQYEAIDLKKDIQKGWTDVYAAGATMYYCMTGKSPQESRARKEHVDEGLADMPEPKDINPYITENFNNIIMKAMAINIHERFKTADEMAMAIVDNKKVLPVAVARRKKRNVRLAGILGGILVVAGLVAGAFLTNRNRVLEKADISIWFVEAENGGKNGIDEIVNTATESPLFEKVDIDIVGYKNEAEYKEAINKAYESGNMPTVFEVVDGIEKYIDNSSYTEEIIDKLTGEYECRFIRTYERMISSGDGIPIGFKIPMIYLNTDLIEVEGLDRLPLTCMSDIMNLDDEMKYMPVAMTEDGETLFKAMFDDFKNCDVNFTDKADFLGGNSPVMLSTTDDYYVVRENLGVSFICVLPDVKEVICMFSDYWAMSNCSDSEEAAAVQMMLLMYSEGGQERILMDSDRSNALPINKRTIKTYREVYPYAEKLLDDKHMDDYIFE